MMREAEVIIIGAGPAGLGAAIQAAKYGCGSVVLFDENRSCGGQLIKQLHKFFGSAEHQAGVRGFVLGEKLEEEALSLGVRIMTNSVVWGVFRENKLGVFTCDGKVQQWGFKKLIIATGAMENALAFPGWTLPGVMGAGACQTMMNMHRVLPGKRVLMVGSGNVGLIVTYQLLQAGAEQVTVIEAAPSIGGYGVHASKITRAGVPILCSHTITEAVGPNGYVEKAVVQKLNEEWQPIPGTETELNVDMICLSVGLSPLVELARLAQCEMAYLPTLGGYVPIHDKNMRTSEPDVYVAGDLAGVEEASTALDEGRLAGVAVAEALGHPSADAAKAEKDAIRRRLYNLRSGSYGDKRQAGKENLMGRMSE